MLVDYGFEDLSGIELFHEEEGVVNQSYQGYSLYTSSDTERRYFGNVMGASENFWADMRIFEGEKDTETLTQKMATGEYVIIGCPIDKLTEEPKNTPLIDQLQVGEICKQKKHTENTTYNNLSAAYRKHKEWNHSLTAIRIF